MVGRPRLISALVGIGLAGIWLTASGAGAAPAGADAGYFQQAATPAEVNAAYTEGLAAHRTDARYYEAYLRRMVELGMADSVTEQARTLLGIDPENGFAWAVVAFDHAGAGRMPEAFSAAVRAAEKRPNDPFIASLAGQLVGWYEIQPDKSALPPEVGAEAGKLRDLLGGEGAFVEGRRVAMEGLDAEKLAETEPVQAAAARSAEGLAPQPVAPPTVVASGPVEVAGGLTADWSAPVSVESEPVWPQTYDPYGVTYSYEYPYDYGLSYRYDDYSSLYLSVPYVGYAAYYVPQIVFHHRWVARDVHPYYHGHFIWRGGRLRFHRPVWRDEHRRREVVVTPRRPGGYRGNVIRPLRHRDVGRYVGRPRSHASIPAPTRSRPRAGIERRIAPPAATPPPPRSNRRAGPKAERHTRAPQAATRYRVRIPEAPRPGTPRLAGGRSSPRIRTGGERFNAPGRGGGRSFGGANRTSGGRARTFGRGNHSFSGRGRAAGRGGRRR